MFELLRGRLAWVVVAAAIALGLVVFARSSAHVPAALPISDHHAAPTAAGAAWTTDQAIERRVNDLLAKMTLDEKIGQLNQFSQGAATGPGTGRDGYEEMVAAGKLGSILNLAGAKETNKLQHVAMERSRLKIPLLFGLDVIHGYRTTFPIPLALAATWDPDLVQRTATVAAHEASADGVRWTFSPMVDIARDARWGRIIEGAGEDPYLGSVIAKAYVRGYQGEHLSDPGSIASCVKHFVGYGAAEAGREYNSTYIPERLLREVYLPPFQAAVDAGAATLMSAFNSLNDVPASANPRTLDQILRKEWGFRGFVVSDWTSIKEIIAHGIANDGATAARKAITAGVDMDMEGELYLGELAGLVKAGKVPVAVIDESVRRILRVKLALGLFEHPYTPETTPQDSLRAEDVALAKQAALESFVLLKNGEPSGEPVLPLASSVRRIAVIGPLADDAGNMFGGWAGNAQSKYVTTLRAALTSYAAGHGIDVAYERGTDILGGGDAGIARAVAAAQRADVVLLAVGENGGDMTGEASSRAHLDLPGEQGKLVAALASAGTPVVMIVFSGHPLALTPYATDAAAIVQAWHPGIQAGPALVDVLTGAANFSGHLTVSLPRSVGQEPLYYNALNTGRPADGIDLSHPGTASDDKYKSRYIDELNAPLYPFGYGLSYTRFAYSPVTLSTPTASARAIARGDTRITVHATVQNIGTRDGVEVAQLYIRRRGTSVAMPVRELKGYRRLSLRAGEARELEFTLGRDELSLWNTDLEHVVEPAEVTVWVAPDSRSGSSAELAVTE